jgi:hypothetical protein
MAADHAVVVGWNRAIAGKEKIALELFASSLAFYGKQMAAGTIASFEPVMLRPHGGDFNGFILIRGERAKLDALIAGEEFLDIMLRATLCIEGVGVTAAWTGAALQDVMGKYMKLI